MKNELDRPKLVMLTSELPYSHVDGVNNLIKHLLPQFKEAGINIDLISTSQEKGFKVPGHPDTKFSIAYPAFYHQFEENKPDLVFALAPVTLGMEALAWASEKNIPRIASFNTRIPDYLSYYKVGFLNRIAWSYCKFVHNMAQLNLAPSNSVKEEIKRHGIKNIEVWDRGVNSNKFNPKKRNDIYRDTLTNGKRERPIVLYVGRMSKEKNLEIFKSLIPNFPKVQFVFVGDGPIREELENSFSTQNTTFTGTLKGIKLEMAYASADIFINPSITEGFSNTTLEAFSSGLPAIGFDSPGVGELIKESGAGLLVSLDDPNVISDNLSNLLDNPKFCKELGMLGRQYALTRTWEECFDKLMEYYRSVKS